MSQRRWGALAGALAALGVGALVSAGEPQPEITLRVLGSYRAPGGETASEISAYDAKSKRLFVNNSADDRIDVLSIANPASPTLVNSIDLTPYGAPNSVAVHKGVVAVAVESNPRTNPGQVVFFDVDGAFLNSVQVGAVPDMLTYTPNGQRVLVANEGEPSSDYESDPEGSVSIIDVRRGERRLTQDNVTTVDFQEFNSGPIPAGVRVFGPGATPAEDFEPEYITVSADSRTAWVTLQENNAIARIDVKRADITGLFPLGVKNHNLPGNGLDVSDRDEAINIANWPVSGFYLPDAIASYKVKNKTYLVTANEGDAREWGDFAEEERVKNLDLDPVAFPNAATLQLDENLGRLNVTTTAGDANNDGLYEQLFSFGGRSFTIWNSDGQLVWDSGDDLEQITAEAFPDYFNASNNNSVFDDRSDSKGPEPEGVTIGEVGKKTYAFVCLERIGGVVAYDITRPTAPSFVYYANNRDFAFDAEDPQSLDLGPEGVKFISAKESPTKKPLVVTTNEISGTTTVYEVVRN